MTDIIKINDPLEMLEKNKNSLYVTFSIGNKENNLLKLEELDLNKEIIKEHINLENQIKNFKFAKHLLNINETLIIKTPNINEILIYNLFNDEMFLINKKENFIYNAIIIFTRYIVLFISEGIEVINITNLKGNIYRIKDKSVENVFKTVYNIIIKEDKDLICQNKNYNIDSYIFQKKYPEFKFHNVSSFVLQKEQCYVLFKENIFLHKIILDNKEYLFNSVFDLCKYIKSTFFNPLKLCTFIVNEQTIMP